MRSNISKQTGIYLYLVPGLFFFAVFNIYPLLYNIYLSFFGWDAVSPVKEFLGFENILNLFTDRVFWIMIRNTFIYAVFTVSIQMLLGLILAAILFDGFKGVRIVRGIIFVPCVIAPVAIGVVFSSIFRSYDGSLNELFRSLHLPGLAQDWLGNPKLALFSILSVNIWQWTGFSLVMYLAGMTSIPSEIYEASAIDGASPFRHFWAITVPMLANTHKTLVILGTIGSFKVFDLVFVLTKGGPFNSTEFFATYIYKSSFIDGNMGYGAAISVVLIALTLVITVIQLRLTDSQKEART